MGSVWVTGSWTDGVWADGAWAEAQESVVTYAHSPVRRQRMRHLRMITLFPGF